jgi:hypothetical protein
VTKALPSAPVSVVKVVKVVTEVVTVTVKVVTVRGKTQTVAPVTMIVATVRVRESVPKSLNPPPVTVRLREKTVVVVGTVRGKKREKDPPLYRESQGLPKDLVRAKLALLLHYFVEALLPYPYSPFLPWFS